MSDKGDVLVTYTAGSAPGGRNKLLMSTIFADGRLSLDRPFATIRENHFDPWMATLKSGRHFLVWLGFDGPAAPEQRAIIGMSTSDDGQTWAPSRIVNDVGIDCPAEAPGCLDKPMIAIGPYKKDPTKEAIYVFYWSEPAEALKMVRSLDGGATFAASVKVSTDAYGDVQLTGSGVLHVVNGESAPKVDRLGDTGTRIVYTRSDDAGETFTAPVVVSAPGEPIPSFFSNPQVASDETRKVLYAAYPTGLPDGRWELVLAASTDGGKSWSRAKVNDDAPCANHMTPMMKLDAKTGRVHLVWLENRTGAGGVAYTSCALTGGKLACAPNEAVSATPFASYELVRHSKSFLGEYGAMMLDAKRRALHVVWTQTVAEDGGPTARVFYAKAGL
jgi:hypothetical protein